MTNKALYKGSWHLIAENNRLGPPADPFVDGEDVLWVEEQGYGRSGDYVPTRPLVPKPGQKIYRVITQRDEFFGGQFDPDKLQQLVNRLAMEDWRVVSVATADVSTFFGTFWSGRGARQEIIVFLEKDAK